MQVRAVSVIDGIGAQAGARATYTTGVFAPRSDDYPLDNPQVLQDRRQWWSGITPNQEELISYRQQPAGRNLYCLQYDGGNIPYSIPINIWTIQCLQTETAADGLPIDCQLTPNEFGYRLTVANRSKNRLAEGYVQLDPNRRIEFGAVGPGESKEFSSELPKILSWDKGSRASETAGRGKGLSDVAVFAPGRDPRRRISGTGTGAAVMCALRTRRFRFRSWTGPIRSHVQWVRQVIFPTEQKEQEKP
jgi:hypothetical protein